MYMKKVFLILLFVLLLSGCNKEEEVSINYDNTYYKIAKPYNESKGNYSLNSYDKNEVESMLMNLSNKYFSSNNSYYEEGQYLSNDIIKDLLINYNDTDKLLEDNVTKSNFITTIYEQDYLASNGNLKGISLALVLNRDQKYMKDGKTYTQVIEEKDVLDYGKEKANKLLSFIRTIPELQDKKIVIGLYVESDDYLKGNFKYIGDTTNNEIELEYINYNYKLLDSGEVLNDDLKNYNNFEEIKKSLDNYDLYIKGEGLYIDNNLIKLDIILNDDYFSQVKILEISDVISEQLSNFDCLIDIKVYFKSNDKVKAFLTKEELDVKVYILEE